MIMDLVLRKQKNRKRLAESQRKVLSFQPAFHQAVIISVDIKTAIQSIRSKSQWKFSLYLQKTAS